MTSRAHLVEYVLPDGRIVRVAGSSSLTIPYQLADGRVVTATRANKDERK